MAKIRNESASSGNAPPLVLVEEQCSKSGREGGGGMGGMGGMLS